jgi:SsrA-binding protein
MRKQKSNKNSIFVSVASNKKAYHDFFIEETFEAGLVLEGWEVKSIRAARVQLRDSYVIIKQAEAWILGMHISPIITASTTANANKMPDATRLRKLLLHRKQIDKLFGKVQQQGYSLVLTKIYFKKSYLKAELALAKGKKLYDKRQTQKEKDLKKEAEIVKKQYS